MPDGELPGLLAVGTQVWLKGDGGFIPLQKLGGGFKYFQFFPLFEEDSHFD